MKLLTVNKPFNKVIEKVEISLKKESLVNVFIVIETEVRTSKGFIILFKLNCKVLFCK